MNTISGMNAQAEAFSHFLNLCEDMSETGILSRRPYFNCRERGFVITVMGDKSRTAKHFAWFEHRNSDMLCCVAWEGGVSGKNGAFFTVSDIPEEAYPDKWSTTKAFQWGAFGDASVWLRGAITDYRAKAAA